MKRLLAGLLCVFLLGNVHAQYPDKPVRLIVPFPPGGGTDALGRILAAKLGELWGQQVVVENRAGATGTIGAELVAKSPPDGHSLYLASQTTHAVAPYMYARVGYDPLKDFSTVVLVAHNPLLAVTHPSLGVKSIKELVASDTSAGNGLEVVWETRFVDWAGNLTVSPSKRVALPRSCGFESYGVGISPVNDLVLTGSGDGAVGGSAILTVSNPDAFGTFDALSLGQFAFPLFSGVLLIDPTTLIGPFFVPTVGGQTTMVLPLPPDPALAGLHVYFQAFGLDATKPDGIALSNGVDLEICQ